MSATEALEALRQGKSIEGSDHRGTFIMQDNGEIYFNCGEPDCCEWTHTEAEFLAFSEEEFRVIK